jgi:hypothetical protein
MAKIPIARKAADDSLTEKSSKCAARMPAARPRVGRIRGSLKEMGAQKEKQISR